MSKQNTAGAAPQENKMGVLPVGKLLAGMAVPMMISMLVQALYNIVDSVFVSGSVRTPSTPWVWRSPSRA